MKEKAIPYLQMPTTDGLSVAEINEPFVDIFAYGKGEILVDMQYEKACREGAISTAFLRKEVADRLLQASKNLPRGYRLKIFDAWRPYAVQKSLYDEYFNRLKEENPTLAEEELHKKARTFVSFPDKTEKASYVHSSGGAVDLTIVDENGVELDMGTPFDDFSAQSLTSALEKTDGEEMAKGNRRLLYGAMIKAGFTNYPSEWWHYDFGDLFWAAATGNPVRYLSVYTQEEMKMENDDGGEIKL